jgi:CheY-like chemotaxis protein
MKSMILIVDDDPEILDIMSMNLEENGLEVHITVHPKEAPSLVEKYDIKLCILDIGMKEMSGYDLMKILKGQFPDLKLMCVSGYADLFEGKVKALGVVHLLSKPFSPEDLLDAVQDSLNIKKRRKGGASKNSSNKIIPSKNSPIRMDIIGDNFVEIVQVTDIGENGAGIFVPHSFSGIDISRPINAIVTLPGQNSFKAKGNIKEGKDNRHFNFEFNNLSSQAKKQIEQYGKSMKK